MSRNISLCTPAICGAMTLALFATALHAADACDAVYNAGVKSVQAPHHVYSTTTTREGKPQTGEAIYAGGVEYLQLNGKWMHSPVSHAEMIASAREKLKTHPDTCTLVGDQAINGLAVTVYKVHDKESGTDQQVRILKSNGLMQGGTLTLPDGSVVEGRYEYDQVQAPAGVQ